MADLCRQSIMISGDEALAGFRQGLTGPDGLRRLAEAGGRLLVNLAVGVGKSAYLLAIVEHILAGEDYDLVVILVARKDLLEEIRSRLPAELPATVLVARPRSRCGSLDAPWRQLEEAGCGHLAREQLCRSCPRRQGCPWPGQYSGERLRGARLILATQQHLALDPGFIGRLRMLTGAQNVLVMLDESDVLVRPAQRTIDREHLDRFLNAQERAIALEPRPSRRGVVWREQTHLIAVAPTDDLRGGDWRFPAVDPRWAVSVQRAGQQQYGPAFRFPAFDLASFARSDRASRERSADGGLRFTCPPDLGDQFILFSATIAPGLVRYRLDPDHRLPPVQAPFELLRFEHPGTRWYNLRSGLGSARHFPRNSPQLLGFYAELIARNIREGRRTLLVARKPFVSICAERLGLRLRELGIVRVRFVTGGWDRVDRDDPRTVPVINYGISGINRFEEFQHVYCLTGYYISPLALTQAVADLEASADRYAVRIETRGQPPRRVVRVEQPDDRETIVPQLAEWAFERLEADVVLQAVGRVRPFTRPREVITFQLGTLPGVKFTREFRSLAEARAHFGISTRRRTEAERRAEEARRLRAAGVGVSEIARQLAVSPRTIRRYL